MPDTLVITHASATLAGLKTGNLFPCPKESKDTLSKSLNRINRVLVPRGARMIPLKTTERQILLYLYRPKRLYRDLQDPLTKKILLAYGYPADRPEQCVKKLIARMQEGPEFPHEVGLFLGYPAEDVQGFIVHGAKGAKFVGTWKVYGDAQAAEKQFALYRKCTRVYLSAYEKHRSFARLVVNG